ncbi:MAG: DUF4438 domain-containing protein [Candidatus Krumholzibacteriota bacterium]|nr:DUF4438 domain-containing protein [Candidatus Krumholzibacteriota bacterium]
MIKTNRDLLVMKSVIGFVSYPRLLLKNPYLVDSSGEAHILPGTGGITYNVCVGDSAVDFAGDHIEPGVSITLNSKEADNPSLGGLSVLTCVGNEARVVTGEAAGEKGVVTGKHGGVEHVIIDFSLETLEKLVIGDKIQIRSYGQGLRLIDFPGLHMMNIDPGLLGKIRLIPEDKRITIPVTHIIPASLMGSGLGSRHSMSGDYDIQIPDPETMRRYGLEDLRLGDVIAVEDADCRYGRTIKNGAMSVGIVVHASCVTNGHGPGVTVIMSTVEKLIMPEIEKNANIACYLGIGRVRREKEDSGR